MLLLTVLVVVALAPGRTEAGYRFSVPEMRLEVTVNADASVTVDYDILFQNEASGLSIDVVDVGLFHGRYSLNEVRAEAESAEVTRIEKSTWLEAGVEIRLAEGGIPRGESDRLRVEARVPDMVFRDLLHATHASLRITPTWFGERFVTGRTDLTVIVRLPFDIAVEEVFHQDVPFSLRESGPDGPVVTWRWPSTRLVRSHEVGVSFPAEEMERLARARPTWLGLILSSRSFSDWVFGHAGRFIPWVTLNVILLSLLVGLIVARRGIGDLMIAGILLFAVVMLFPRSPFILWPVGLLSLGLIHWRLRRRLSRYLPPIVSVEGGGIKRGLTAPGAAALLELPVGRVVTLVLFGLLEKGIARVVKAEPTELAIDEAFKRGHATRLKEAASRGVVLHEYEHRFIDVINSQPGRPLAELDFKEAFERLIDYVSRRMEGFDLAATREYYQRICRRAWTEVEGAGHEVLEGELERWWKWLFLEDQQGKSFDNLDVRLPSAASAPVALWLGAAGGGVGAQAGIGLPGGGAEGAGATGASLGTVAAVFATWTEGFSSRAVEWFAPERVGGESWLTSFGNVGDGGGVYPGGGVGGGGGCACAGCACACACAGGGR